MKSVIFGAILCAAMAACTKVQILDASYAIDGNQVAKLSIKLKKDDLKMILDREYYFSIKVIECNDKNVAGYPIEPYVDGRRASSFNFSVRDPAIIQGSLPSSILDDYSKPCVTVSGGGYVTGKLKSNSLPLLPEAL